MQASKEELLNVVEGILFVSGQGVEIKDIAEKLEVDQKKIEKVIEELKEKHKDDGFNIITYKKSVLIQNMRKILQLSLIQLEKSNLQKQHLKHLQ